MKLKKEHSYIAAVLLIAIAAASANSFAASHNDLLKTGDLMLKMDREDKIKRNTYPGRLGDRKDRRCKACEEREREARFQYFSRAIAANHSGDYQDQVKRLILADEKFVKSCWARLSRREIEVFFTINEQGKAEDFAWFPNKTYGKCLSKHVTKIEFPKPEKAHYSWMVASELVVIE